MTQCLGPSAQSCMGVRGSRGLSYSFTTCSALNVTSRCFLPSPLAVSPQAGLGPNFSLVPPGLVTVGSWHSCADGFSPSGTQKGLFIPRRGCSGSAPWTHS